MDTIKSYLENLFQSLPKNESMLRLKEELLVNMESKYIELRQGGASENEAIGKVIAEFGNLDEIMEEWEIEKPIVKTMEGDLPELSLEEARAYLNVMKRYTGLIAFGVAFIILGVAGMLFLYTPLLSQGFFAYVMPEALPVIFLLIAVAISVGLFIYADSKMSVYAFIEKGDFFLSASTKSFIKEDYHFYKPQQSMSTIIGVGLCILSAVPVLVFSSANSENMVMLGVVGLLVTVAVGVFILIAFTSLNDPFKYLLNAKEYHISFPSSEGSQQNPNQHPYATPADSNPFAKHSDEERVMQAISALLWPIAVCLMLVGGFVFDRWDISWIVFPIAGILQGAISSFFGALNRKH